MRPGSASCPFLRGPRQIRHRGSKFSKALWLKATLGPPFFPTYCKESVAGWAQITTYRFFRLEPQVACRTSHSAVLGSYGRKGAATPLHESVTVTKKPSAFWYERLDRFEALAVKPVAWSARKACRPQSAAGSSRCERLWPQNVTELGVAEKLLVFSRRSSPPNLMVWLP